MTSKLHETRIVFSASLEERYRSTDMPVIKDGQLVADWVSYSQPGDHRPKQPLYINWEQVKVITVTPYPYTGDALSTDKDDKARRSNLLSFGQGKRT